MNKKDKKAILKDNLFVGITKNGYIGKFKPLDSVEKRELYQRFTFLLQVPFRCSDGVKIVFEDGTTQTIMPRTIKSNCMSFLTNKKIKTIRLGD